MELSIFVLGFIFIVGLVIGSFLNVVILRTVSGESIVFPASKCPKCQNALKWYHNIPLFSYIFLRGKCAFCKEHISLQYPIVELITGLLFVGLFIKMCNPFSALYGLSYINDISPLQVILYLYTLIVTGLFISIAGTDFIEKKVADVHTYSLIALGIIFSSLYSAYAYIEYSSNATAPAINKEFLLTCPFVYTVICSIAGFAVVEIIARIGLLLVKARAFGEGDSYIAAGLGSTLGAMLGCSMFGSDIITALKYLSGILILSVLIQIIAIAPIFLKKLIVNKNWMTLGSMTAFIVYCTGYCFALNLGWLSHNVAYISSTILLVAIGLFTCRELLYGIKENAEQQGLYLPFGPAMIIAGFIAIFTLPLYM